MPAALGGVTRGGSVGRIAAVAGIVVLAVAVAAWLYLRDGAPEPAASGAAAPTRDAGTATAVAPVAAPRAEGLLRAPTDELLDKARTAFRERRYTDPEGDNALYFYRSAIAQEPENGEAREGLDRIATVLDARMQRALAERRTEDAAQALEQLKLIRPDDTALSGMEAGLVEGRIEAAIARADPERAGALLQKAEQSGHLPADRLGHWREQLARLESEARAERLAKLVSARVRDGRLVAPPNDSAKHYLAELIQTPGGARRGATAASELGEAYVDRARRAAVQGHEDEASQWLAEARALGVSPARMTLDPETPAASAAAAGPTATEERLADSTAAGVPDANAAVVTKPDVGAPRAPTAAAEPALTAEDFKRTRYVAPTYPPQALARGVEGEVRLRLTISTEGRVAKAEIVSASPPGVFETAALAAVRRWRFDPVMRAGRPTEASITTTIRFRPDDARKR